MYRFFLTQSDPPFNYSKKNDRNLLQKRKKTPNLQKKTLVKKSAFFAQKNVKKKSLKKQDKIGLFLDPFLIPFLGVFRMF